MTNKWKKYCMMGINIFSTYWLIVYIVFVPFKIITLKGGHYDCWWRAANLGQCLALKSFKQRGIYGVPYLLWHRISNTCSFAIIYQYCNPLSIIVNFVIKQWIVVWREWRKLAVPIGIPNKNTLFLKYMQSFYDEWKRKKISTVCMFRQYWWIMRQYLIDFYNQFIWILQMNVNVVSTLKSLNLNS